MTRNPLSDINDILDLSRIEAGKLDVAPESVPLPELVADIESLMAVRAEEKKIAFQVDFEGQVPRKIKTDPTRLRQVLINLIGNAIKFTDKGQVRLKVRFLPSHLESTAGDYRSSVLVGTSTALDSNPIIEFAIAGTGIGMSEEQIERLFKPFSQGDSSVTRQYGGSGLGLAISQRLVQMMSGEMDLRSELGSGSTFFVRLPIDQAKLIQLVAKYTQQLDTDELLRRRSERLKQLRDRIDQR